MSPPRDPHAIGAAVQAPVTVSVAPPCVHPACVVRYLVPADLTVGQFVYVVRKRLSLPPDKALFVFVKNSLPPTAALMSTIYAKNKDADGFLYVTYSGENTFGG